MATEAGTLIVRYGGVRLETDGDVLQPLYADIWLSMVRAPRMTDAAFLVLRAVRNVHEQAANVSLPTLGRHLEAMLFELEAKLKAERARR